MVRCLLADAVLESDDEDMSAQAQGILNQVEQLNRRASMVGEVISTAKRPGSRF